MNEESRPRNNDPRKIAEQVAQIKRENARLLDRLADTERRFHRISRGVLRAQEEERGRISRDLHDGIGQSLTALKIQLELLEQEAQTLHAPFVTKISSVRELAEACLAEVRELSHLIRPQILDELGLLPTLRWLIRTVQQRTGVSIGFHHEGTDERADADTETLVFRLVQEALTNVVKHAQVKAATVMLRSAPGRYVVRIEDHGAGFDAEAVLSAREEERGFGVRAMRDRVQSFNGRFILKSFPGLTFLEAEVPWNSKRAGS